MFDPKKDDICNDSVTGVFPNIQDGDKIWWWFVFDYLGDFIYLSDILFYKKRVLYMENGFWVKDKKRLTRQYVREGTFKLDLLALLPLGE